MYYFFGAGNNCPGALHFFGKERVIAIVDNSRSKEGTELLGVPIINYSTFLKQYNNEMVIITAFIAGKQIALQLEESGISHYFICPYMQSGFYDVKQIIKSFDLRKYNSIALYDKNPIAELIREEMLLQYLDCHVVIVSDEEMLEEKDFQVDLLLIVKEGSGERVKQKALGCKTVLDLYDEMEKRKEKDYNCLRKFKCLHQGQRCFLIGNGPSLKTEDLDRLYNNKETCFGCNQIYKIYDKTAWRPNYYVIGDSLVYKDNREKFTDESTYFIRNFKNTENTDRKVKLYTSIGERYFPEYPTFSDDLVKGIYGGRTVMYDMLQIAVYMGFSEIYLLGVDFSWGEDGKNTHFCKDYMDDNLVKDAMRYKEEQRHAYISAKKYAEEHGIKIINATRGGHLDVFVREDLGEIFKENDR